MPRYIDADNLIKKMQEQYNDLLNKDGYYDNFTQGYGDALSTVENEPTADVQKVRHGKMNMYKPRSMNRNATYKCSVCGKLCSSYYNDVGEWKFCPHCGAKSCNGGR